MIPKTQPATRNDFSNNVATQDDLGRGRPNFRGQNKRGEFGLPKMKGGRKAPQNR